MSQYIATGNLGLRYFAPSSPAKPCCVGCAHGRGCTQSLGDTGAAGNGMVLAGVFVGLLLWGAVALNRKG